MAATPVSASASVRTTSRKRAYIGCLSLEVSYSKTEIMNLRPFVMQGACPVTARLGLGPIDGALGHQRDGYHRPGSPKDRCDELVHETPLAPSASHETAVCHRITATWPHNTASGL